MNFKEYKKYTNKEIDCQLLNECEKNVRKKNCGNCYPQQLMYEYNKNARYSNLSKLHTWECRILLGE